MLMMFWFRLVAVLAGLGVAVAAFKCLGGNELPPSRNPVHGPDKDATLVECPEPYCGKHGGCRTKAFCEQNAGACCEGDGCNYITCPDNSKCLSTGKDSGCDALGGCKLACADFSQKPPFVFCDKEKGCDTGDKGGCGSDKERACFEPWCNGQICLTSLKKRKDIGQASIPLLCPKQSDCASMSADPCWLTCKKIGNKQLMKESCPAKDGFCVSSTASGCGDGSRPMESKPFKPKYECLSENNGEMLKCHEPYCLNTGGCGSKIHCKKHLRKCCEGDKCNLEDCASNSKCLKDRDGSACDKVTGTCKLTCMVYFNEEAHAFCDSDKGCSMLKSGGCGSGSSSDSCSEDWCNRQVCDTTNANGEALSLFCPKGRSCQEINTRTCSLQCSKQHGHLWFDQICPATRGECSARMGDGCGDWSKPIGQIISIKPPKTTTKAATGDPKYSGEARSTAPVGRGSSILTTSATTTQILDPVEGAAAGLSPGFFAALSTLCLCWFLT